MAETLLIELLTEELPPRALARMGQSFAEGIALELKARGYCAQHAPFEAYAAPRRLAVRIPGVEARQPDRVVERKGPNRAAGLLPDGTPSPALAGFARSCGVAVEDLVTGSDNKGVEVYLHRSTQSGTALAESLQELLPDVLAKLPVQKVMRWGGGDAAFVRPVHGLVALHGSEVLAVSALGHAAGRSTMGHRFLGLGRIELARAEDYPSLLERDGKVIASFAQRRERIRDGLTQAAQGARLLAGPELLDEVTALVEWPVVYAGHFDAEFLAVPQECLILSMQQHQKYFPLGDAEGRLSNRFLLVSNIETDQPGEIIHGNERVLRARLSDARFFFQQDQRVRLDSRLPGLANVVYHNKLGSMLARVERLSALAAEIATGLACDAALAGRAARLCKADLVTDMVGEFPELQGVMGSYYARHDGEDAEVVRAIGEHYRPRFAGDALPETPVACAVALADKLDTLVGIYGIGQIPTGDKDPFGLRRQALGVVRILMERQLPLDLRELLARTVAKFPAQALAADSAEKLYGFVLERLRHLLRERAFSPEEAESVLVQAPGRLDLVPLRLDAVRRFRALPEAASLAAANKRIRNILRKSEGAGQGPVDSQRFVEAAEAELHQEILRLAPVVEEHVNRGDHVAALQALATAHAPVDRFFDQVMVMADDPQVRENRLALLARLDNLMNRVADISRLSA
ncbi:MAG: glycine--tRNA ligase subunit beta [Pseudomonadota bacterium]|nr:glycine--tRNA ligase subunit beta [Pseudomonadota bacterium]